MLDIAIERIERNIYGGIAVQGLTGIILPEKSRTVNFDYELPVGGRGTHTAFFSRRSVGDSDSDVVSPGKAQWTYASKEPGAPIIASKFMVQIFGKKRDGPKRRYACRWYYNS
jgi:hypothetical protein